MSLRLKKRGEKALERALVVASPADVHYNGDPSDNGANGDDAPDSPASTSSLTQLHRRETAEGG